MYDYLLMNSETRGIIGESAEKKATIPNNKRTAKLINSAQFGAMCPEANRRNKTDKNRGPNRLLVTQARRILKRTSVQINFRGLFWSFD